MVTQLLYLGLLAAIGVERLLELRVARANTARTLARGGVEVGQRHFRFMKAVHALFLLACAVEVLAAERPLYTGLALPMLGLVVAAQGLRYWAISALGPAWNLRVVVVPGASAARSGPYRWLRHPNYLAVIVEGVAIPLVHTAVLTAAGFTLVNGVLLWVRIRCEEEALSRHCDYQARFAATPRLLPLRPRAAAKRKGGVT